MFSRTIWLFHGAIVVTIVAVLWSCPEKKTPWDKTGLFFLVP